MVMLEAVGVTIRFNGSTVIGPMDLATEAASWTGVIGPNGAGKTTLLRALAGLVAHDGVVRVAGVGLDQLERRAVARRIAYVPQAPARPPGMSVASYVGSGRTPHRGYLGGPGTEDAAVVRSVLAELDLVDLATRSIATLSGGELQRAAIGRALAQEPDVLLLDEPTASLDLGHTQEVLRLLDHLRRARATTVVTALHDLTVAGRFADRLVLLAEGRIAAEGTPDEVLRPDVIRRHYGARVHVLTDPGGDVAIVPDTGGDLASES
jgi:iron complex transport system ATP-binding protein